MEDFYIVVYHDCEKVIIDSFWYEKKEADDRAKILEDDFFKDNVRVIYREIPTGKIGLDIPLGEFFLYGNV